MNSTASAQETALAAYAELPPPHGGRGLQCCDVPEEERAEEWARAASLPRIEVSSRAEGDMLMFGNGAFSPLRGFMGREDWQSVCRDMTLADGTFWPLPITLDVAEDVARALRPGDEAALWRTKLPGGHGAVAEVVRILLAEQGKLDAALERYRR